MALALPFVSIFAHSMDYLCRTTKAQKCILFTMSSSLPMALSISVCRIQNIAAIPVLLSEFYTVPHRRFVSEKL
jgi:hypothetical protein